MVNRKPYLLNFGRIGDESTGFHSYGEYATTLPFEPKRVYWLYDTPEDMSRGNVANIKTKTVLISIVGKTSIHVEDPLGKSYDFELEGPEQGLFLPEGTWRRITMDKGTMLLGFASEKFEEKDHIRDFRDFKKLGKRRR